RRGELMTFSRTAFALIAIVAGSSFACSPRSGVDDNPDDLEAGGDTATGGDGFVIDTDFNPFETLPETSPGPCKNLQCKQVKCATGTTSVSGTVYAPTPTTFGPA